MKNIKIIIVVIVLLIAFPFTGCKLVQNANNTQKGVAIGASTGALI
jgi:type III secretory pathway component EscS